MVATHEDQHEAIDATLAEHAAQLELLRRNLDRQFQEIRKISLIVGEHTQTLAEHGERLQRIEDKLDRALGLDAG